MPRLKLKEKKHDKTIESSLVIKRSKVGTNTIVSSNHPDNFILLTDNRFEEDKEKFSRVSRYIVQHYYLIGTEWVCERLFYPSSYGWDEIEADPEHPYKKLLERLVNEGVGLLGERQTPKIYKQIQRIQLKCKPKRLQLTCKE